MVGFHRTFSTPLHLCEIAEILQTFIKGWSGLQKSQGHKA